jgi:hypothetical protein
MIWHDSRKGAGVQNLYPPSNMMGRIGRSVFSLDASYEMFSRECHHLLFLSVLVAVACCYPASGVPPDRKKRGIEARLCPATDCCQLRGSASSDILLTFLLWIYSLRTNGAHCYLCRANVPLPGKAHVATNAIVVSKFVDFSPTRDQRLLPRSGRPSRRINSKLHSAISSYDCADSLNPADC